jgi:hypothetical protein
MKQIQLVMMLGFVAAAAPAISAAAQQPQQAQPGQSAQRDSGKKAVAVPAEARPPKGMCRIWIDGVPAAQQPAATDCTTAVKNRPANGRVIFGDDFADSAKTRTTDKPKLPPEAKGFTGVKPPTQLLPKRPPE